MTYSPWESLSGKDRELFETVLRRGLLSGNLNVEPGDQRAAFLATRILCFVADSLAHSSDEAEYQKDRARQAIEEAGNKPIDFSADLGDRIVAVAGVIPGGGGAGSPNKETLTAIAKTLRQGRGLRSVHRIFKAAAVFEGVMRSRLDDVRGNTPDGPTLGEDIADAVDDELVNLGIHGLRQETLSRVGDSLVVAAKRDAKYPRVLFLLDTSGSMARPERLPTLQGMLWSIAKDRHAKGTVVTFGQYAGEPFALNPRTRDKVLGLSANGGTEIGPGIDLAERAAPGMYEVILVLTDGVLEDARSLNRLRRLSRKKGRGTRARTIALHVGESFKYPEHFDEVYCVRDLLSQGSDVFAKSLIR